MWINCISIFLSEKKIRVWNFVELITPFNFSLLTMFRIVFDSAWVALLAQGLNTRGTSKVARRGRVTEIIMHKVVQNNQQLK